MTKKYIAVFPVILFVAITFLATNLGFSQATSLNPNSLPILVNGDLGTNCSGGQIHDDGTFENGYGWNASAGNPSSFATKFIPTVYPYKFTKFCIALTRTSAGTANWTFKIMMWKSVNGMPGIVMDSTTVTATGISTWPTVTISDFTLPTTWAQVTGTDSVYIGVQYDPTITGHYIGSDESTTTPLWDAWATTAAGPWQRPAALWTSYKALGMRAEGEGAGSNVSWTEQTSGITTTLYSVSAVNDDVAWVSGASGKVLRTVNKGINWVNVSGNLPTTYAMYCIFAWDANTAIVTGVSGSNTGIYQTSNGGTNWTTANTHAGFGDDLYMSSATNAYFIGDPTGGNWDLLKSTNAGLNWSSWSTLATTNTNGTYNNAAMFLGQQVWFCANGDSKINYTSNMGTNWVQQTIPLTELAAMWFNSSTVGLAGGSSTAAGLLKTTNSGTNWTTVTQSFIGAKSIAGITGTGNSWWVAKQDSTIYYSSDNGTTWSLNYTRPTAGSGVFYHMSKARTGATIWAVRSNGKISRYGTVTGINTISSEVPSSYSISQNYPNPFNPVTKINFSLPKSGLTTLKVYDILGKEVASLVNEVKNAGTFSVDFNGTGLSSGIYFYKIESNGFSAVKKMMLVK